MDSQKYRNRVRVRVNGLLVRDKALLLVKIDSPVIGEEIWMPPGGGVEFGETLESSLVREFKEETGLDIGVGRLRHVNEFIRPPFHAIEFYYEVSGSGEKPELGSDPEHRDGNQIIKEIRFVPIQELASLPVKPDYVKKNFPDDYQSGPSPGRIDSSRRE